MDRGKFSTYRAALQLRHFAALLSAETSGILGEKLFPSLYTSVAAFRLQARCPSWSSQRQSAEIQCKAS